MRADGLFAACDLPIRPLIRGAREHSVFAGHPDFAAALEESGNAVVHRRGADDAGLAQLDQHAAFRGGNEVRRNFERAHLVGAATIDSQFPSWCRAAFALRFHGFFAGAASLTGAATGVNFCCPGADAGADARGIGAGLLLTMNVWLTSRCPAKVSTSWPSIKIFSR